MAVELLLELGEAKTRQTTTKRTMATKIETKLEKMLQTLEMLEMLG